jgi:hypothetical protein
MERRFGRIPLVMIVCCWLSGAPAQAAGEPDACSCASQGAKSVEESCKHTKVLEFKAHTTTNEGFTRTIRNVTSDDDVFLHVRVTRPLTYGFSLSLTQTDSPDQPLLNVSGDGLPGLGSLIKVADAAQAKATDTVAANKTAITKAKAKIEVPGLDAVGEQLHIFMLAPGGDDPATRAVEALRKAAAALGDDPIAALCPGCTEDLNTVQATVFQVGSELRVAAVSGNEQEHLNNAIKDLWPPSRSPEEVLTRIQEQLAQAAVQVEALQAQSKAAMDLAKGAEKAHPGLTKQAEIVGQSITSTQKWVTTLQSEVAALLKRLADLGNAIVATRAAIDEGEMCLYLGRFDAGKRVAVKATIAARPAPAPSPEPDVDKLRKAVKTANAALQEALGPPAPSPAEAGKPAPAKAAADGKNADDGAVPAATPSDTTDAAKKTTVSDPSTLDRLAATFDVLRPIHVQTSFGFPVTWLRDVDYSLVSVPQANAPAKGSDASTTPADMVKLVPQNQTRRVLPTFFVSLNLVPQYPFSSRDDDKNESLGWINRHGASLILGFPLQDLGKNYMFGVGFYAYRGIQIVGGVHFGRVTRLRDNFKENEAFTKPTDTFGVSDAVYTPFESRWFLGVSVDSTTIAKILGGGSSDK